MRVLHSLLAVLVAVLFTASAAQAQPATAFTYQGYLEEDGGPAAGTYDFRFILYDSESGGSPVGDTATREDVAVTGGVFAVELDVGSVFGRDLRYLEVAVRDGGSSGGYTTLSPREALRPAPSALTALALPNVTVDGDGKVGIGTETPSSPLTVGGAIETTSGGIIFPDGTSQTTAGVSSGGAWSLGGNAGTDPPSDYLGTSDNAPLELRVNATRGLRLEPFTLNSRVQVNVIGGNPENRIEDSASGTTVGATIAGGGSTVGSTPAPNVVSSSYGTIGGGFDNTASGFAATIGGGTDHTASFSYVTIGGGQGNTASALWATVGGGQSNVASAQLSTVGGGLSNEASGNYATIGGGGGPEADNEHNVASGVRSTVGGGGSHTASGDRATIGGGFNNNALGGAATIGGGRNNIAGGGSATIGGGFENVADGGSSTSSGGASNRATGSFSVISGGFFNLASGDEATVGGGDSNEASGERSAIGGGLNNEAPSNEATVGGGNANTAGGLQSTVGGGQTNTASGNEATISGGLSNIASGLRSTVGGGSGSYASATATTVAGGIENAAYRTAAAVGGGSQNEAGGSYSVVPGGRLNQARGDYSFAAGRVARVQRTHSGTFAWSDSGGSLADSLVSTGANQFLVRARGGIWLGGASAQPPSGGLTHFLETSTGAYLSSGGTWTNSSSRALKTDFTAVDVQAVLERVGALELTRWRYKADGDGTAHLGPMAEEFHAAFGLGSDPRTIGTVDADGVALAAIQGLLERMNAQADAIETQADAIDALEAENDRLRTQQRALERQQTEIDALRQEVQALRELVQRATTTARR